ncbi:MAG: GNAT family N-acetyltransferase [Eubacterium sp.]|nr:GNAT family N-acetyltransferase [Eubacterium sp.]
MYSDGQDVVRLWQEAFGDSEEEICYFLDNAQHAQLIAYYEGDELAAMLFAVDCNLYLYQAKYIYAACTAKKYRGKGYMSQLLDFCRRHYDLLCLIPAQDSLVEYYRLRGFTDFIDIEHLTFDETEEIQEYLLEGYQLTKPQVQYYNGVNDNGMFVFS